MRDADKVFVARLLLKPNIASTLPERLVDVLACLVTLALDLLVPVDVGAAGDAVGIHLTLFADCLLFAGCLLFGTVKAFQFSEQIQENTNHNN